MDLRTAATVAAIVTALALVPLVMPIRSSANGQAEAGSFPFPGSSAGTGRPSTDQGAGTTGGRGRPGPLNDVDRRLLLAVRRAGPWEIPAGRLARTRASSEAVQRSWLHLIDGHTRLDQLVREDARLPGVRIPDEATAEQRGWAERLEKAAGAGFDRRFTGLLRASHGKVSTTAAQVRGATQNDICRRRAREANQAVLDHIEVLEDTGLIEAETFR